MATTNKKPNIASRWTSYWAFLMAAVGSSVGLGNVWKFPYEVGLHGGGTFLLVYIPCVFLIGFPLMMAELMIGRRSRSNPVHGIRKLADEDRVSRLWQVIGWLGMLTSFLIFSYYSVVASWILFYIMKSISGSFVDAPAEVIQNSFGALLRNSDQMLIWHTVFVLLVVMILSRDLRSGLDRAVRWLMPCFIALVIWLCIYASQVGDFEQAMLFVFSYNLADINPELIVSAVTQALFSLSIGMGIFIMYGSYLGKRRSIFTGAGVIVVFDSIIALLMAVMIFSIVFAFGMQADAGPGLMFKTLPVAFSQMTSNSVVWSTLFFALLLVAALTSALALLDPIISWMTDQFSVSRRISAWFVCALAWSAGWLSIYSFSDFSFQFYYFSQERVNGFFDLFNILTTHVLLPLTALLLAIFTGWRLSKTHSQQEQTTRLVWRYKIGLFFTRVIAPLIMLIVLFIVLFIPA